MGDRADAREPLPPPSPPRPVAPQPARPDTAWREHAACRGHKHPDLWYGGPDRPNSLWPGRSDYTANINEAIAICRTCPVRNPCLAHALAHDEQGVWGGLTEDERKKAPDP
ncbi:hypothetical protein B4N89_27355 [Embleya scabrispora]|uniref:Transcriptional regulator WhiB n=2 Tax=Embleya scabrispora TaxID=159449 RepID=A0A1T3P8B7_9ACTN|nr:hypothetical protein B4N89_27355 [Embleya scabrispora]